MKIPESWKASSTHRTLGVNTMSLLGLSLLWGHMLDLISLWVLPVTIIALLSGFGNEIVKRDDQ